MTQSPKNISALMCELSVALAELSEKMSNLSVTLENSYLESNAPETAATLEAAFTHAPEVHVLDSPFYAEAQLAAAHERSARHFAALGHPELADHYHHHSRAALAGFAVETLYEPVQGDTPFPWLRIVKSAS